MEWNSFYSNACYECGNWGEGYSLNYCKNCRAVGFCEKDSKTQNPKHKDLCEVLTQLRGASPSVFTGDGGEWNQASWALMKTNLMLITQLKLGRKLNKQEEEVLKFPKRCVTCFETDHNNLTDCKVCPGTSFCPRHMQSKEEHSERCRKITECAASDVFFSPMLRRDIPSVPEDQSPSKLPEDMNQFIKICGPNFVPFPHNVQTSASSEVFTRPLSLLYGIEKINYEIKDRLVVHVVGASAVDLEDPSTFEIILHFRPNLKEILLVFVGPDLEGIEMPSMTPYLCRECKKRDVKLDVKIIARFYHEFFEGEEFLSPDVVVGYNIGVHECVEFNSERDTWAPTIKTIGGLMCPLIVTSYTQEEAQKDYERILGGSENFVGVVNQKNPFGSLRHYRDFENDEFYYQNQFIMVFKGGERREGEVIGRMEGLTLRENVMVCD
ncbi:uncharacterized protein LOC107046018 [Diachasma alloeum]|uniref:uncharacterized protein LOC107046018 n=1 Tax=Diachasma alloeum TaxID=454923 RepID=UPI000738291E|nr:uncharacterized protein LOC107046018 [Diachasma alloeum]